MCYMYLYSRFEHVGRSKEFSPHHTGTSFTLISPCYYFATYFFFHFHLWIGNMQKKVMFFMFFVVHIFIFHVNIHTYIYNWTQYLEFSLWKKKLWMNKMTNQKNKKWKKIQKNCTKNFAIFFSSCRYLHYIVQERREIYIFFCMRNK